MTEEKKMVSVTATVTMTFELEESEIPEKEQHLKDHAHDLLSGFFTTYPQWLDGSVIRQKPKIDKINVLAQP